MTNKHKGDHAQDDVDESAEERRERDEQLALLRQRLAALRAGTLRPERVQGAIVGFGRARLLEARPDVEAFLRSDDSELRRAALNVLALDFGLSEHAATARAFLERDPDVLCRMTGASALGFLQRDTHDPAALQTLAQVVANDQENVSVRSAAYAALQAILSYLPREQFAMATSRFRFPDDVDWALVQRYAQGEQGA